MTDEAFEVEVDTGAAGPSGEAMPRRFRLGRRTLLVEEIVDRWPGRDHLYVKLRASDGDLYILRHDLGTRRWGLVFFQREGTAAGDAAPG